MQDKNNDNNDDDKGRQRLNLAKGGGGDDINNKSNKANKFCKTVKKFQHLRTNRMNKNYIHKEVKKQIIKIGCNSNNIYHRWQWHCCLEFEEFMQSFRFSCPPFFRIHCHDKFHCCISVVFFVITVRKTRILVHTNQVSKVRHIWTQKYQNHFKHFGNYCVCHQAWERKMFPFCKTCYKEWERPAFSNGPNCVGLFPPLCLMTEALDL